MALQQRYYCRHLVRRFETVKVIAALTAIYSESLQFFPTLSIPHANSPPVIALQQDQGATESKALHRQERAPTPPYSTQDVPHELSLIQFRDRSPKPLTPARPKVNLCSASSSEKEN